MSTRHRDLIFFVRVRAYEKSVTGMEPLKGIYGTKITFFQIQIYHKELLQS